ncbi:MAG: hypothetical protein HY208_01660 [Nitrospirae bacterium]|nr:hypothetical protein [Nitrospirota bacterium]
MPFLEFLAEAAGNVFLALLPAGTKIKRTTSLVLAIVFLVLIISILIYSFVVLSGASK